MSLNAENSPDSNAVCQRVVTNFVQKLQAIEIAPIPEQIQRYQQQLVDALNFTKLRYSTLRQMTVAVRISCVCSSADAKQLTVRLVAAGVAYYQAGAAY